MKKYYFVGYHDSNKPDAIIQVEGRIDMGKLGLFTHGHGFDTEKEVREREGIKDCPCKVCGGVIKTRYNNYKEFEKLDICFDCHHWAIIYATIDDPKRLIVDGKSYWAEDDKGNGFKGFGGHNFKYQRFDSDEVKTCTNMWHQGEIPDVWREKLKDNAKFIKE